MHCLNNNKKLYLIALLFSSLFNCKNLFVYLMKQDKIL